MDSNGSEDDNFTPAKVPRLEDPHTVVNMSKSTPSIIVSNTKLAIGGSIRGLSKSQTDLQAELDYDCIAEKGWATLPHVILERVFLCLSEKHRPSAMYACKRWYSVMRYSASLWREKKFRFSGRDSKEAANISYRNATNFVRSFGKYLTKLEFRLYNPATSNVCRKFQKTIRSCFVSLIKEKSKLKDISIPSLQMDRGQWTSSEEDFTTWLAKFFCKGQHTLERVTLSGARMSLRDGYKVLFSLGYEMGETVTYLDIEDFFCNRRPIYMFTEFVDCLRQFNHLQTLYVNYSYVSDDFLEALFEKNESCFERLHIKIHAHDPHDQIVQSQYWSALKNKCPNCRVDMNFQRVMSPDEHFRILCPQIPLRQVSFEGSYFAEHDWEIGPTISTLLPHYKDTLEKLTLDLPDTYEIFETQLLSLVELCNELYYLKISAFVSTRLIDRLLTLRENGKCALDTLKVRMHVRNFDTSAEERDLERIYNSHKDIILEKFYEYNVSCCVTL